MEPVEILFVVAVFVIPALAVSARIAVRPVVDALVRLSEALGSVSSAPRGEEVRELRARIEYLEDRLAAVEETTDFHLELKESGASRFRRLPGEGDA